MFFEGLSEKFCREVQAPSLTVADPLDQGFSLTSALTMCWTLLGPRAKRTSSKKPNPSRTERGKKKKRNKDKFNFKNGNKIKMQKLLKRNSKEKLNG